MILSSNSKLSITDNSGVRTIRLIIVYDRCCATIGTLFVGSISKVKPHRRLKKGQILRSLLVQTRRSIYRPTGSYVRSLATRAILMKKTEYSPLANRASGFFFLELRISQLYKFSLITVYFAL